MQNFPPTSTGSATSGQEEKHTFFRYCIHYCLTMAQSRTMYIVYLLIYEYATRVTAATDIGTDMGSRAMCTNTGTRWFGRVVAAHCKEIPGGHRG